MKKTAIIMDSTGYLTSDIIKEYDIRVVTLNVNIGDETFQEIDLTNRSFFGKLEKISGSSTTSQPAVGAFLETYKSVLSEGYDEIISIHLSQKISGTYASAVMAKDLLENANIHIFDSGSSALGLGLLTWAAADWAREGFNAQEILGKLDTLRPLCELYFIVDTLEFLHRGGRIGGASALFGTLLQIKPILYFNSEGIIDVFEKVRSKNRALQRTYKELERALSSNKPHRIAVIHVGAETEAISIAEELSQKYQGQDIRIFEAGPVIATHVGPGALGLAFHPWPH
ncbi:MULTISPECIES: DegV family protein [Desulfitobacterium]|uniref:EDD domain protein, DegV family n=1 Tax=Desulfitobacterium dehalogenans (strain ATCC 51507 / DSM 9161 / JW/IU-DC1) TaxID=756499 RepID=I4A9H0_DESDJ|nr:MULTISPECIES: DegV family protein [Desulfitobacterium]AFM00605.1 EDD domain protein, DegV family [Desulfitobacterium dehalogenans ATCC 51507]